MKIVFMGTPSFAVPCLNALLQTDHTVVGVFTQPDRPKGRGKKPQASPVKERAEEAGIPVYQPERIRVDGIEQFRALQPDLCVTAAFGQIISQEMLDIPIHGCINVHASLLPEHRGASPVAHAIMAGDRKTGVTTMKMDAGIDTGPILLQSETEIRDSETCEELTERLSNIGAELLITTLKKLEEGTLKEIQQDESRMTYDPMLTKNLSEIDFHLSAARICGLINGLNPWPCASVPIQGGRLKLMRAAVTEGTGTPGSILTADHRQGLKIACGNGAVRIIELQAPGGKILRAEDYLRGHNLEKELL